MSLCPPLLDAGSCDRDGIPVWKTKNQPPPHVECELLQLGIAGALEFVGERPGCEAEFAAEAELKRLEEPRRIWSFVI